MLVTSISFFNELATENKNCDHRLSLIMASNRITLWKDTMSRDKNGHDFQDIFTGWKKNTFEGTHVEGYDRGKEIRLQ
jgi:hypothetical protein